eukprot:jgi/Undpi1/8738/HiC_scaffold_25.g11200.m1
MESSGLPPVSEEELVAASVVCILAGVGLCFFSHRTPVTVVSGLGGLLFGVFCINEILPQFGESTWQSAVGSSIGGSGAAATATLISAVTVSSAAVLKASMIIMTSSAGALLMACGTDLALDRSMITAVGHILQMRWAGARHCSWGKCQLPALLLLWAVLTVIGMAVQGHASGILSPISFLQRLGLLGSVNPYTQVGSSQSGRSSSSATAASNTLSGIGGTPGGIGNNTLGGIMGGGSESGMAAAMALASAAAGGVNARVAAGKRKTWTYSENHSTWNYFDMEALPHVFCANKDAIFVAAETLANMFGFQDDNVRNQVEHLLTLLANHRRYANEMPATEGSLPPKSAVHSLHSKVFTNYRDWCESMRIAPNLMPLPRTSETLETYGGATDKAEEDALVLDLMMWLCMWGEAGNLRHMPECLCFLFHKMMQVFRAIDFHGMLGRDCPALYGGYFLDHVVTPLYEVITRGKKGRADHDSTRNYDDYNEFFWTPTCLLYVSYRSDDHVHLDEDDAAESGVAGSMRQPPPPSGVIPIAVGLESAPKTFVEKRSIFSTVLCFNRVLEFHILTFQLCAVLAFGRMMVWDTPYFLQACTKMTPGVVHKKMASTVFWSVNFLGIVWTIIEAWQAYPGIQMTSEAKCGLLVRLCMRYLILIYQSLYFMWSTQRIEHPDRTGMQAQGTYVFWWWQYLWLSFFAMVPYVLECFQQIFPALLNICYPLSRVYVGKRMDESVGAAARYIFFWGSLLAWKLYFSYMYEVVILVLPTVELYDDYVNYPGTSYWGMFFLILLRWIPQMFIYLIDSSIWFACWSAMTGSVVGFQEKLGEVRDFPSIRKNFMQIPAVFCSKVICPGVSSRDSSALDISAAAVMAQAKGSGDAGGGGDKGSLQGEAMLNEASRLLSKAKPGERVYLPIFQTAGSVELAVNMIREHVEMFESEEDPWRQGQHEEALRKAISADVTVEEALSEVWELGVWLIRQLLGAKHEDDMGRMISVFNEYINGTDAMRHLNLAKIHAIVADTTSIVSALHHALPKREPFAPSSSSSPRPRRSPSGPEGGGKASPSAAAGAGGSGQGMIRNNDERGAGVVGTLSFMTNTDSGFMWDDDYASERLDRMAKNKTTLSILEKLHGLLGINRNDAEPHSVEARRRLAFFTNSLFMDMPRAPPVGDMMSWSCVTPFYSEDVVYSRDDLDQKNEDGLTTLMYLQALYKHDWRNFMERKGITSEQQAMSKRHIKATRLWASFRAQTLARTVEGIMYYEAALRLLARLERIREEQAS